MSGYVEAGYLVVVIGLGGYAASLAARERAARRRLPPRRRPGTDEKAATEERE